MSNDAITPPLGPLTTEHHQMNEKNLGGSIDPDDPLLIAQTLTYVTDNGSVVMSYSSAPFSFGRFYYCHSCSASFFGWLFILLTNSPTMPQLVSFLPNILFLSSLSLFYLSKSMKNYNDK